MEKYKLLKNNIYKDIIFELFIILISIPLWMMFNVDEYASIAKFYNDYNYVNYTKLNEVDHSIKTFDDVDALKFVETEDLLVYNNSNTYDDYSLLIKMDKNISTKGIKVNVNYDVKSLDSYDTYEDNDYKYFILDSNTIVASSKKYIVSLWSNDSNIDNINYDLLVSGNLYA